MPPALRPSIALSIRAVGTFRPKYAPQAGKVFSDELNVIGTAFWLKEEKVLITCAHVIQNLISAPLEVAGLLVVGKSGNYQRALISSIDIKHDLAVLQVVGNDNRPLIEHELEKEAADGLEFATAYLPASTPVAYAGFPLGNQLLDQIHSPTYAEGVIGIEKRESLLRKEIQISGPVIGGFSGAPVVIKGTNQLIGVVSNGPAPNNTSSNIFMSVSWEHVKALANLANS